MFSKFINQIWIMIIVVMFSGSSFLFAETQTADKKQEEDEALAKVIILPFEDRTKTNYFGYMSESLAEAINYSMVKVFNFKAEKRETLRIVMEKIKNSPGNRPKTSVQKIKKIVKKEDQARLDEMQESFVSQIAQELKSDIVIFGSYSYDIENNELIFSTAVYLTKSNSEKELDDIHNIVDNTIFQATEKTANNLVEAIHELLKEAEKKQSGNEAKKQEEKNNDVAQKDKKNEKFSITKKDVEAISGNWSSKKFSITLLPAFSLGNLPMKGCGNCELHGALLGRFWLNSNIFLGLLVNASAINNGSFPLVKGEPKWWALNGVALIGYGIPVGKWLFSADAGAGYYLIFDKTSETMYNPDFLVKINAEVLLGQSSILGIFISGNMYYDTPNPLFFYGVGLSFGFAF